MFVRITLLAGALMVAMSGAAIAGGEAYESPIKDACNAEIEKDGAWYRELGLLFANQMFFDPRTGVPALPEVKLPEHEPGYTSPRRAECTEEMKKDNTWMAQLRSHYEGALSYDFQTRNTKVFTKNKQHVMGAYGALLVILVGFIVMMYLRQRKLAVELERLREDVSRAAKE